MENSTAVKEKKPQKTTTAERLFHKLSEKQSEQRSTAISAPSSSLTSLFSV